MTEELALNNVSRKIYTVNGHQVMMDSDLASLYEVETRYLNQAVKRNIERFPPDFMFQLTDGDYENLMFQIGTSSFHGGRRKLPYVFTENGVAMLSSVLGSKRAIEVNIFIMRTFVALRKKRVVQEEVLTKLAQLEKRLENLETGTSKIESNGQAHGDKLTMGIISEAVANFYFIGIKDLKSLSRSHKNTHPRQMAIYLIRKYLKLGFKDIGKYFNKKNHTTVLYACRKVERAIKLDNKIRKDLRLIQKNLE